MKRLALLLVVPLLGACQLTSTPTDVPTVSGPFLDPTKLAADMKQHVNQELAKEGNPGRITQVVCIPTDVPRQFLCNDEGSDGTHDTVTATVSEDGLTWITGR